MGIFGNLFGGGKKEETTSKPEKKEEKSLLSDDNASIINITPSETSDKNVLKLTFEGQLDESNVEEGSTNVKNTIKSKPNGTKYIFDFEELKYMNSMAIGQLSEIHVMITEADGDLIVIKANDNIAEILKYARLDTLLTFAESEDEALQIFKNQ